MSTQTDLITRDLSHIWHPYTQMKTADAPIPIVAGKGAELYGENGEVYIDAVASWWTNLYGHAHPYLAEKLAEQARKLEHVIFAGFTHPSAIELAERLLPLLPLGQSKVFFSDNGSTAVEVGIKMAIQYFYNQGIPRKKVIAFDLAYHGDTFGTMSVGGDLSFYNAFQDFLYQVERIPAPVPGQEAVSLQALESHLQKGDVAAFVFEPLVLGAGGMVMYEPEVLDQLMARCKKHGVLCVADEVMTGFGRTGKLFATLHCQEKPDIIALSKGLTAGMLPMAITTCSEAIYQAFYSEDKMKALYHGHSFTGNPLGCAVALAGLDLLLAEENQQNIQRISNEHATFLEKIKNHPRVLAIRQRGTILAIEFRTPNSTGYFNNFRDHLYRFFLQHGLILRPLGNVVYILPPYCITNTQLKRVYQAIEKALDLGDRLLAA